MTRVITFAALAVLMVCLVMVPKAADGAEEPAPAPQEPKAHPPKPQEQRSAEPRKEESKKEESKKEEKAQVPTPKSQEAKPSEPPSKADKAEPKKEEPTAPASTQKAQESKPLEPGKPTQESKPPEPTPAKPSVPPIIPTKLALMADPRLLPYDINVEISGETAELSGKVATDMEKAAATEIARGLEGIKSVTNNIEVVKDLSRTMAKKRDEMITQYVKDRFGKSKTLDTAHFDVKSEDGIVSLSGKTKFLVIVLEAAEAARQVPGVKAVRTEGIRLEGADEK